MAKKGNCPALCTKSSHLEFESNSLTPYISLDFKLPPHCECCIFWVIPRRQNFLCRRFGTLSSVFIARVDTTYEVVTDRVFRNFSTYNSDGGESPKRNNTTSYILILVWGRWTEIQGWLPRRTFRCCCFCYCCCCCFVWFVGLLSGCINEWRKLFWRNGLRGSYVFCCRGTEIKQEWKSHAVRTIF